MPLAIDKDKITYSWTTNPTYYWNSPNIATVDCSGISAGSITANNPYDPLDVQHLSIREYISIKVDQKIKEHDKKLYEFLLQNRMINISEQEFLSIFEEE